MLTRSPLVVVMGVTGCGKSTVGEALAHRLGVEFADADAFHSAANIAKMASGQPLDDADRAPWLLSVADWLRRHDADGAVVGCSALRRRYRDVLRSESPRLQFLHLAGDRDVLAGRVANRPGHFMPASLIESQLATLEPLEADERGAVFSLVSPVDDIVAGFIATLDPG